MAYSYSFYKEEVRDYLKSKFKGNAKVLDVGAGCGTYWNLLHNDFKLIDAVEVYKPNIDKYNLKSKYHRVYNINIKDFQYGNYDIIIFGDIIEHLNINDAQNVLKYALNRCKEIIVAVPYELEQDEVDGNIHEIHKQDDLTPEIMKERYPYLKLLYKNDLYGYYVKGK